MGSNARGQLGINDPQVKVKHSPVLVQVLCNKGPTQVTCGDKHTLVLCRSPGSSKKKVNGVVYAWGDNQFGQTGGGGSAMHSTEVVYSPRRVNFEHYYNPSIVRISCGSKHSAFVDDTGRLFQCGLNKFG